MGAAGGPGDPPGGEDGADWWQELAHPVQEVYPRGLRGSWEKRVGRLPHAARWRFCAPLEVEDREHHADGVAGVLGVV